MKLSPRTVLLTTMLTAGATALFTFEAVSIDGPIDEVTALEEGDSLSTVGPILQLAGLDCDALELAADAAFLEIPLSFTETITADKVSFETQDGSHFADLLARFTWHGVVSSPAQGADELAPRKVSVTWSDPCEAEAFVFTVTSYKTDGSTVVNKSIPCDIGGVFDICLVEVTVATFLEDSEVVQEDESIITLDSGYTRRLRSALNRNLHPTRNLQEAEAASVDVLYLYTEAARVQMGGISTAQMISIIFGGLGSTNAAFINSDINLTFNVAHIGFSPSTEDPSSARATVIAIRGDADVAEIRSFYQADLVQVVGHFETSCSAAFEYDGDALTGFSAVNPACIENLSHTQAFGYNLGCYRNREDSVVDSEYEHGYRTCEGDDPFSTIMSIKCPATQAPRINYFSNPEVSYRDQPTGTETENCARAVRANMGTVENYQPVVDDTPTPTPLAPTPVPTPNTVGPTFALPPMTPPTATPPPTTEPPLSITPAPGSADVYPALGCWTDDVTDRVLSGGFIKNQIDMTTEKCAKYCSGPASAYFGTEFGSECFCGFSTDDHEEYGESTGCTMPCTGDAGQICGGNTAINIYSLRYTYVGCFVDSPDRRVLTGELMILPAMTLDLCFEFCAGAPFFGTEFGVECFCGTEVDDPEVLPPGECDLPCAGAPTEICGGRDAITVYRPIEFDNGLGCYADKADDRIFEVKALVTSTMTTELCADECSSFTYYGTQNKNECWCGNDDNFTRHGVSEGCTMTCGGAVGHWCGGRFAMNVYMSE